MQGCSYVPYDPTNLKSAEHEAKTKNNFFDEAVAIVLVGTHQRLLLATAGNQRSWADIVDEVRVPWINLDKPNHSMSAQHAAPVYHVLTAWPSPIFCLLAMMCLTRWMHVLDPGIGFAKTHPQRLVDRSFVDYEVIKMIKISFFVCVSQRLRARHPGIV